MATSPSRYSTVALTLHWVLALLIIGQIAGGFYMHNLPASSFKFDLYQLHKSFGLIILILSLVRLGWRLTHPVPHLPAGMKGWEVFAARATHILFYVMMIGIPLAGWLMVSASPKNIPTELFGVIPWPDFPGITRSEGLEDFLKETHVLMAKLTIGLLVLHVVAGLKHHFVNKDDVLTRMVPFLKPRS